MNKMKVARHGRRWALLGLLAGLGTGVGAARVARAGHGPAEVLGAPLHVGEANDLDNNVELHNTNNTTTTYLLARVITPGLVVRNFEGVGLLGIGGHPGNVTFAASSGVYAGGGEYQVGPGNTADCRGGHGLEAYGGLTNAAHPGARGGDGVNGTGGDSNTSEIRHGAGVRGRGGGDPGTEGPGVVGETNSFVHPAVGAVNTGGSFGLLATSGGVGARGVSFGAASAGVEGVASGGGPGVWGFTQSGHAVLGNSQSGNGGVFSSSAGYGVAASTTSGAVGVFAKGNPIAFQGQGNLTCTGTGHFNGGIVVPARMADGSLRGAAAVVSPETVVEDFGRARLVGGIGVVELDRQFAELADTADYAVFPIARGDCKGLYVANQSPAGFEVRELQGGASNLEFDYRVVARLSGRHRRARFARVEEPPPPPSFPPMPPLPTSIEDQVPSATIGSGRTPRRARIADIGLPSSARPRPRS